MKTIDHHAHFIPPGYRAAVAAIEPGDPWQAAAAAFLERFGPDGSAPAVISDLDSRLPAMDAAGIQTQLLCLGASTIWHQYESTARRLTEAFNEGVLEAAAKRPGRFALFASVSLPHVKAAVEQSRELAGHPDVAGFGITGYPAGRALDDPNWRPLLECWSDLGSAVFVHPDPPSVPLLWNEYWLRWGVGAVVEDALVSVRLIASGVLKEFPGIKWIIPHAGGGVGLMLRRLDSMWDAGRLPAQLEGPPSRALEGLWFDTAGTDPLPITVAAQRLGPERLLFGSDYPLGETLELSTAVEVTRSGLGAEAPRVLARDIRSVNRR